MKTFYITSVILLALGGGAWFVYKQQNIQPKKDLTTKPLDDKKFNQEIPVLQNKKITADDILVKKEKIDIDSKKVMLEFLAELKQMWPNATEEQLIAAMKEDRAQMRIRYQNALQDAFFRKIALKEVEKVKDQQITAFIEERKKEAEEEIYMEVFKHLIRPSLLKAIDAQRVVLQEKLKKDKIIETQRVVVVNSDEQKAREYADEIMKACQNIAGQGGNVKEFLKKNYDTGHPLYYYDEETEMLSYSPFKDRKNIHSGDIIVTRETEVEGDRKERIRRQERDGQKRYAYQVVYVVKVRLGTPKEIEEFTQDILKEDFLPDLQKKAIEEKMSKYEMNVK